MIMSKELINIASKHYNSGNSISEIRKLLAAKYRFLIYKGIFPEWKLLQEMAKAIH